MIEDLAFTHNVNIHIRIKQRNGKKVITVIENLDKLQLDLKKIAQQLRKQFHCASVVKNNVIELQGDHRVGIKQFIIDENIVDSKYIMLHGY